MLEGRALRVGLSLLWWWWLVLVLLGMLRVRRMWVLSIMGIVHRGIGGIAIAATLVRLVGTARSTAARVEGHGVVHLDLMQYGASIHRVHSGRHIGMPLEVTIVIGILLTPHHLAMLLMLLLLVLLVLLWVLWMLLLLILLMLWVLLVLLVLLVLWLCLTLMIGHECPSVVVHLVHTPLLVLGLCASSSTRSVGRVAHRPIAQRLCIFRRRVL
jgi:hypothetical protein